MCVNVLQHRGIGLFADGFVGKFFLRNKLKFEFGWHGCVCVCMFIVCFWMEKKKDHRSHCKKRKKKKEKRKKKKRKTKETCKTVRKETKGWNTCSMWFFKEPSLKGSFVCSLVWSAKDNVSKGGSKGTEPRVFYRRMDRNVLWLLWYLSPPNELSFLFCNMADCLRKVVKSDASYTRLTLHADAGTAGLSWVGEYTTLGVHVVAIPVNRNPCNPGRLCMLWQVPPHV